MNLDAIVISLLRNRPIIIKNIKRWNHLTPLFIILLGKTTIYEWERYLLK